VTIEDVTKIAIAHAAIGTKAMASSENSIAESQMKAAPAGSHPRNSTQLRIRSFL
jgi:hypothetical protein